MASGGLQPKSVGPQIHILIMIPFCVPVVSVTHGLLLAALWAYLKVSGVSTQSPQSLVPQIGLVVALLLEFTLKQLWGFPGPILHQGAENQSSLASPSPAVALGSGLIANEPVLEGGWACHPKWAPIHATQARGRYLWTLTF